MLKTYIRVNEHFLTLLVDVFFFEKTFGSMHSIISSFKIFQIVSNRRANIIKYEIYMSRTSR